MVVISGAPGMGEREKNPLLHHKVREFDTQKRCLRTIDCRLHRPGRSANRVAGNRPRPPRRLALQAPGLYRIAARHGRRRAEFAHHKPADIHETSDPVTLRESLAEAVAMLNGAKDPSSWPTSKCIASACKRNCCI